MEKKEVLEKLKEFKKVVLKWSDNELISEYENRYRQKELCVDNNDDNNNMDFSERVIIENELSYRNINI